MSRGFLVIAFDSDTGNYLKCAEVLARSLALTQSEVKDLSVMVPRGYSVDQRYYDIFDRVIWFNPTERDDTNWKAYLKHQAYKNTPYDETILMDADMIFPVDVSHWWDALAMHDMVLSSNAYTYKGLPVLEDENPYRQMFRYYDLPTVYTALMYFKKTEAVRDIFSVASYITENWNDYRNGYTGDVDVELDVHPTDDFVFAAAIKETAMESVLVSNHEWFGFVHLKMPLQRIRDAHQYDAWFGKYLNAYHTPQGTFMLGDFAQTYPVHYHDRSFASDRLISALKDLDHA